MDFSHLHVHTQFSLLDGAADISKLFKKAKADGMKAMAITDHGNMFGVFKFVAEAGKHGVKPIVGCEFYVVEDRHKKQFTKEARDVRYHQLFLAKNAEGYQNLSRLCSLGYIEGLYSKWPRIDKELILKYHKGLIATTCCLGAEVPRTIMQKGEEEGEKVFKWWLDLFGEDYYIELQRHEIDDQNTVNEVLLRWAVKYNVKVIASNDSHYVDQQDYNAHDILLCVNTGDMQSTPKATDEEGGKGYRFGFPNDQFYFKSTAEMSALFHDVPQAIDNTNEIVDKIDTLKLKRDILVPHFPIPQGFIDADDYLRHLTFEGAHKRYSELTADIEERLNFELHTIKTMGFPGYFLIVADFIKAGRDLGVLIGPGRGSAAGSAVAYCIGITNIDPIKYKLLFERFLNPERKSMPDIDTDFDDIGRQKVLDYVIDKYGKNQVAQIINYGTMAAKSAIKDVARVMDLHLSESVKLTQLVPDRPGTTLEEAFKTVPELEAIRNGDDLRAQVLKEAIKLEGSVRNTGIHASAVIIAPDDLLNYIPLSVAKDANLWVTQFDGKVIEDAGLLKMDFLGLKTLTIIKNAIQLIEENHGIKIDPDSIPLDDKKTYELFQRGDTISIFQFESPGMQKHLKDLKPDKFEDLIAMNALYRPGPMEYIPTFIKRKHGLEKIKYDFDVTEDLLSETYGVTVYQEQVMLLSQRLAGFSKGDADVLRKAMGKKQITVLQDMKSKFLAGCESNGHDTKVAEKVWTDWEAFASYAFNKSHATCYSFVAFQTAYLKAHYPAEYMAATLDSQGNIESISFFMEECRNMNIPVLGPDINESNFKFSVNQKGEIRIGLGALKGVGEAAVLDIVAERKANGIFSSIYDLVRRINLRSANKKTFESLAFAGAFDCFKSIHRAQYFYTDAGSEQIFLEKIVRYGNNVQEGKNAAQHSLFGDSVEDAQVPEPPVPVCEEWGLLEKLHREKEVIGMFISGHPLDTYKIEMGFCSNKLSDLNDLPKLRNKDVTVAGMITGVNHRVAKTGNPFGNFTLEDYSGSYQFTLFAEPYLKMKHFLVPNSFLFLNGKVETRWKTTDQFEYKIGQMQLLSDVREKKIKSITLEMSLSALSDGFINEVNELIVANPGNVNVKVKVNESGEKISIDMPSKKFKVNPTNEFLEKIKSKHGLEYQFN
ncbi:MAG: DNA polymerase III subunit alpha [Bacteroidetes bacterium]|nr:DNA polymerase III subunit alpha [Bacteroidota bacterium]MBK9672689.1 DNA polymerase III subunit alpha [Bacteroidota bacterium]MBP6412450.1 DNA polymerase III subunit alpha [Bacteroidia bacterium]